MVLMSDAEDNLLEIAFLAENYEQLKESPRFQNGIVLVANHSIDGLLKYVINKLN